VQDSLIHAILQATLEATEAQRGLLIMSHGGEHRIAAEATRVHKRSTVRLRDEVVTESLLPEPVLSYVRRDHTRLVIDGPTLFVPLLHKAKVVGMLLLENDGAARVFTPARLKVLKPVALLAASALENSRLYQNLQEREAKARRLAEANIIGIYIVDIRGAILESNDAYLRMLGYKRGDLVSGRLRWTDLTPPEWHAADKQRVERVKRVGCLKPFEKEFFRKDGTRVPVVMGVARFKEPKTQAVVFALDISQQKRAEASALESRTIEQTRIAARAHDALLQNFQGMIFRFQAARNLITRHPDEALRSLNEAIQESETALDQSRYAIENLRLEPRAREISK
jgi:PAS domain S-box-containing protein